MFTDKRSNVYLFGLSPILRPWQLVATEG